jgi:hypothetical protein
VAAARKASREPVFSVSNLPAQHKAAISRMAWQLATISDFGGKALVE